ncbi:MAG: hypothetical protein KDE20_17480 [Caldilineaceae bacterium]|nr:hypothetical protein [Caldilineaceae bacterium]
MATLTVEASDLDGLEATYNAVAASDVFVNDGKTIIHVVNASGTADTVAIVSTQTVDGLAVADAGGSVPGGEDRFFGPFKPSIFNSSTQTVTVTHTQTTSVTMAVIRVA